MDFLRRWELLNCSLSVFHDLANNIWTIAGFDRVRYCSILIDTVVLHKAASIAPVQPRGTRTADKKWVVVGGTGIVGRICGMSYGWRSSLVHPWWNEIVGGLSTLSKFFKRSLQKGSAWIKERTALSSSEAVQPSPRRVCIVLLLPLLRWLSPVLQRQRLCHCSAVVGGWVWRELKKN